MKSLIKRHKGLSIVVGLSLILLIVIFAILARMLFSSGSEYGDRLNNIVAVDSKTTDKIMWCVGDEEIWTWRKSYDNCLGNRFYKVIIDKRTDKDIFEKIILPCCVNYCYSMDII